MARRARRSFTKEQKANAVAAYHESGNLTQVARELDLCASTLRNWVKQAEVDGGRGPAGALTSGEREELQRLRRETRKLEQERDFLKNHLARGAHLLVA